MEEIVFSDVLSFEWDEGNGAKSWIRHKVSVREQEEAFLTKEKIVVGDKKHSQQEKRFLLYSKTKKGRELIIAFTICSVDNQQKIRPISARSMNRKEAELYEKNFKMA